MTCPDCGYQLSAFEATCPRCEHIKANANTRALATAASSPTILPASTLGFVPGTCVNCGCDAIQKVSSIVQAGTWQSTSVGTTVGAAYVRDHNSGHLVPMGGRTVAHTASMTNLAARLSPPTKPGARLPFGVYAIFIGFIGYIGFGIAEWISYVNPGSNAIANSDRVTYGFVIGIVTGTVLAGSYALRSQRRSAKELPDWQQAMERWNQVYYCHRCDTVFIP